MSRRKLTPQAAFNRVAKHLLRQGERSIDEEGDVCLYRGPNGKRCAVGALIPRDLKPPEDTNAAALLGVCAWSPYVARDGGPLMPALVERLGGQAAVFELAPMVVALQQVHDDGDIEEWPLELLNVALAFNLSPAVLEAAP